MKKHLKPIILFSILTGFCFVAEGPNHFPDPSTAFCSQKNVPVTATPAKGKEKEPAEESSQVTAFYFHGNFRCSNCYKIEQYSREAIELYFSEQLKTGDLTFKVINTDQPGNKHFVDDYQLYTKSLVIAEFKDGRQIKWKNLEKVWNYLNDRDKFYQYVKTEVQKYLEEKSGNS